MGIPSFNRMAAIRAFLAKNGTAVAGAGVLGGGVLAANALYVPEPKKNPFTTIKSMSQQKPIAVGIPQQKEWDARYAGAVPHTNEYYAKCCLGGIFACGLTHTLITPLDVTKCNMQVNPGKYTGMFSGMSTIMKEEGFVYLGGSASAEIFADVALCPWEMIKVKVQTSPAGTFPTGFGAAFAAMNSNRAETRFPFGSVGPLWGRQIPYTMAKFFFFEKVVSFCYTNIFTAPKESC